MPSLQPYPEGAIANHCPFCGSTDIEGGWVDISVAAAYQDVHCNDCKREWTDTYKLEGYIPK